MSQTLPGAVIIGRNEGARLVAALASLRAQLGQIIYVDSGSTDDSVATAQAAGAEVIALDMTQPFTAARARNAGLKRLLHMQPDCGYVQFIDGDCALRDGWISVALAALEADPKCAVVCGRRRERHPEASVYNALIDREWDTPVGPAKSCGGDALMRVAALTQVGGYNPQLIAGEEPELCVRLRQAGWGIARIDAEMTWHDAAMTRLPQWWRRAERAGHAYAEGADLHGAPPERHNVAQTRRALIWGVGGPLAVLVLTAVTPWALALVLIWPLQVLRLARRGHALTEAGFLTLAKFPEAKGVLSYHLRKWRGGPRQLIEYK